MGFINRKKDYTETLTFKLAVSLEALQKQQAHTDLYAERHPDGCDCGCDWI